MNCIIMITEYKIHQNPYGIMQAVALRRQVRVIPVLGVRSKDKGGTLNKDPLVVEVSGLGHNSFKGSLMGSIRFI